MHITKQGYQVLVKVLACGEVSDDMKCRFVSIIYILFLLTVLDLRVSDNGIFAHQSHLHFFFELKSTS